MNNACSATRGRVRAARDHQRHLAAGEGGDVDGIVANADPRHHFHILRRFEFGLAEGGGTKRHAMDRRMVLQQGLEVLGGDQVRKLDEFDVISLGEEGARTLRQSLCNENLLFVGRHCSPPARVSKTGVTTRRRSLRLAGAYC
ncbi:hypothetical protein ACVWW4_000835 [Bradyrhizobium sp. LB7.1]